MSGFCLVLFRVSEPRGRALGVQVLPQQTEVRRCREQPDLQGPLLSRNQEVPQRALFLRYVALRSHSRHANTADCVALLNIETNILWNEMRESELVSSSFPAALLFFCVMISALSCSYHTQQHRSWE